MNFHSDDLNYKIAKAKYPDVRVRPMHLPDSDRVRPDIRVQVEDSQGSNFWNMTPDWQNDLRAAWALVFEMLDGGLDYELPLHRKPAETAKQICEDYLEWVATR